VVALVVPTDLIRKHLGTHQLVAAVVVLVIPLLGHKVTQVAPAVVVDMQTKVAVQVLPVKAMRALPVH
jgi:hypothetical protein